ncbi:DinB family protein [Streptomyces sp. NPDC002851]
MTGTDRTGPDPKADLHRYLRAGREALLWKLEGLGEYDIRRPLTLTGTNLLGLAKHLTGCELGYFGDTFGRPFTPIPPWLVPGTGASVDEDPTVDMWATPDESREYLVGLYRQACAHADETIGSLALDATGTVPHWPAERSTITLHRALVHMIAETHRHAGHADIVRELVDGAVGTQQGNDNLPQTDPTWWREYRDRVERAARQASGSESEPEPGSA